jgi:uncharacterized membrane protein
MVVAFIPFPTSVISESSSNLATIFYALVMALGGLVLAILWLYAAYNRNLIDLHLNKRQRWREAVGSLAIAAIFLLSIGVSFVNVGLVRICWVLIIPISLFLNVRREAA